MSGAPVRSTKFIDRRHTLSFLQDIRRGISAVRHSGERYENEEIQWAAIFETHGISR